jgi:ATP:cob(I)alamin adenosyltransferase
MKRIYTRTGDTGRTRIFGRREVDKDDPRIEANGMLDTLNVDLGYVLSMVGNEWPYRPLLHRLQVELMSMMSLVATPSDIRDTNTNAIDATLVGELESAIDLLTQQTGESGHFLLPCGSPTVVALHRARVDARTAERRLVSVDRRDPLDPLILPLVNRISDLLFALARAQAVEEGIEESSRWKRFNYKQSL